MSKFNEFLGKVGGAIKDNGAGIAGIAVKAATGNIAGAIKDVTALLQKDGSPQSDDLLQELEVRQMEFEAEMYKLEVEDRKSARSRQIEVLKAGGKDNMMTLSGVVALSAFVLTIIVGLFTELTDSQEKVFFHILGIVEGVALAVFNFYYGSSKGSKDKDQ